MAKSQCLTYFFWLIGGWFGLHHLYLRRDRHAFLIWSTMSGYLGCGLIRDLWKIPTYVKDANEDPEYMEQLIKQMRGKKRPSYNFARQAGQVIAGNLWGWVFGLAIPHEKVFGFDLHWLEYLLPFVIALGVHTAGNVGRIQGSYRWALLGASTMFYFQYYGIDGVSFAAFISSILFEAKASKWRRKPSPKHGLCQRILLISFCAILYSSLWMSFLYFNFEITDSSGETIKFRDSVNNFLTSPLWTDFKRSFVNLTSELWSNGFTNFYRMLMDELDPHGERQALKVLGLEEGVSLKEIKSRYRNLSREWHPDKVLDETKKPEAEIKFMEIANAYGTLTALHDRRSSNKKSFQEY